MFFFNGRIRSAHIAPIITQDQPYTHRIGNSCIISTCLALIIGMTLILTGVISRTKKTTFLGIAVISIGIGLSITTTVCFNTQLRICYRNWAYGPPIVPMHLKHPARARMVDTTIIELPEPPTMDNEATCNSTVTMHTCARPFIPRK